MSVWNLLWIVPISAAIGLTVMAIVSEGKCSDCKYGMRKKDD